MYDENGVDKTSLFGISTLPTLQGVTGVTGNGVVPSGRAGRASWIVLLMQDAAPQFEKRYFFGGYVNYVQSGAPRSFVLTPTGLTVRPDPRIQIKYFLQRDVYTATIRSHRRSSLRNRSRWASCSPIPGTAPPGTSTSRPASLALF